MVSFVHSIGKVAEASSIGGQEEALFVISSKTVEFTVSAFARIGYNCNEVIASCVIRVSIIHSRLMKELLCSSSKKGPLQIIYTGLFEPSLFSICVFKELSKEYSAGWM